MKAVVIADIHGSYDSIEKLKKILNKEKPDELVILGDILYHGPRNPLPDGYDPKRVAEWLNSINLPITAVQGNCDSEVDQMVLDLVINPGNYGWNGNVLTHGHHLDNVDRQAGMWIYHGHTHIPKIDKKEKIFNPGSITLPKENHPRTYGVYNDGKLCVKTLDGKVYLD